MTESVKRKAGPRAGRRSIFTETQTNDLIAVFNQHPYCSKNQITELARNMDMTEQQIKVDHLKLCPQ